MTTCGGADAFGSPEDKANRAMNSLEARFAD
jgi:hypothetical protein